MAETDDFLGEQTCRVCGLESQFVTIKCPGECGPSVRMPADHGSDRTCKCGHEVTKDEIRDALDTEVPEDSLISNAIKLRKLRRVSRRGEARRTMRLH